MNNQSAGVEMSTFWNRNPSDPNDTISHRGTTKQFLRLFTGSPADREDLDNWVQEYERKAYQLAWGDSDKFSNFGSFLSGPA